MFVRKLMEEKNVSKLSKLFQRRKFEKIRRAKGCHFITWRVCGVIRVRRGIG